MLNSSLFYWYYSAMSDCEHVNDDLVKKFPVPKQSTADLAKLGTRLTASLTKHAVRKSIQTAQGHTVVYDEYRIANSKPIIDEIDAVLAEHYGFTAEELDFIVNYDIKYRMGPDPAHGDE